MNTAQTRIDEVINQYSVPKTARNVYGFMGPTLRGPINDPSKVIYSWPQFVNIFGGLVAGNDFPLLCQRALARGAALRVCNIKHYSSIADASTLDAVLAVFNTTAQVVLASALVDGQTMQITVNGNAKTQAFTGTSKNTLSLLAARLPKELPAIVEYAVALNDTTLLVVPKTTVTLVVTSTPTGTDAPTTVETDISTFTNGSTELFRLLPINKGADYNNLAISVRPAVSGQNNAFDIVVRHLVDGKVESYPNLVIPGKPTIQQSTFLDVIKRNSNLVTVQYLDLTGAGASVLIPNSINLRYKSGTDGSAIVANDYIGSSGSVTGFQAFNAYDDIRWISVPNLSDANVNTAGDAYVSTRKDTEYHIHLSNDNHTEDAVIAERDANGNILSSYSRFFCGGLTIVDPLTGASRGISEMGDVAGVIAATSSEWGPWYSAAGKRRGIITNALGVVNNFGAKSNLANLNRLANRQINEVIVRDGQIMLWGNFTAQQTENSLRFANVRSLLIEIKKSLSPFLDDYLEEPNDIQTWKNIWRDGHPYMDNLVAKQAIHSYDWQGDQFVSDMNHLTVNNFPDVQNGVYKIRLFIKEVVSLQLLIVEITLDNSSVSFEDSIAQINNR